MLVKARYNVKDMNGWHMTGEIFETADDLGEAVEIISNAEPVLEEKPKATRRKKAE